jgi:8-oxo-dGTP diphosphatase
MVTAVQPDNRNSLPQAASVIVLRRDSVLMVERARPPFQGLWSFPGGRTEPGETVEATARRELFEETGLTVGPLLLLGAFQPAPEVSAVELNVFAALAGPGEPQAGDDAIRAEFVPFQSVLVRPVTAGGPRWIARAVVALAGMDDLLG